MYFAGVQHSPCYNTREIDEPRRKISARTPGNSSSGAGVKETTYYTALANLLDEVGKTLKPRVRCIQQLKNLGAGSPDMGLYSADQFPKHSSVPPEGGVPSRGVIEIKSTSEDAWVVADDKQVTKYWGRYNQVLVTNYRDFVLVGRDAANNQVKLETHRLAPSEAEFWSAASNPQKMAARVEGSLVEFLKRVMLLSVPLDSSRDLAWFLASYAREAKFRIEHGDFPALATVRKALEEALGMTFEGVKGDHFFRSTLVQTLFYGMFSAWVLWIKALAPLRGLARFDWRLSDQYLRVPILRKLFREVADPGSMESMNLNEVLDWAAAALNRVDPSAFFKNFEEEHAVQYFYEPFLEAFDPELRKDLGVWYTPWEIVDYMVERVDRVLREELGLADGLADKRVYVLDPCCGTGAYLVSVLKRIAQTLREKGGDALLAQDLKEAAMHRVFGFEILPAPFVVAHLQLGLLLQQLGAPFSEKGKKERAGVYLTNSLTGWEPPKTPKRLPFVELEEERDAADEVKREKPILVILGNPPYNSFAGIAKVEEERGLSESYRTTKKAPAPQGQGLNDLYVRFFRMAERRIVEKTGEGVVCFISNYSWLDGLSFTGMRERYLEVFNRIWIDNLHGDRKMSEYSPDGRTSETVFATGGKSIGIKLGTAISLMVKSRKLKNVRLLYRDHQEARAAERRAKLLASLEDLESYRKLEPELPIGLPFKPASFCESYLDWPLLPGLFPVSFPGVKTSRDDVVVDIDKDRLIRRMEQYFDPAVSHEEMRTIAPGAMASTARFQAEQTRERLRKRGFKAENVVPFAYRPFDVRWLYWEPETKLLDEKRSDYFPQVFKGNLWLEARQKQPMERFDRGYTVRCLADNFGNGLSNFFPLYLANNATLLQRTEPQPNLCADSDKYLATIGSDAPNLFHHAVATLHAPSYRIENAGALRQDWPRIPLPATGHALVESAALGREIASLLDSEQVVPGVTASPIRAELRPVGIVSTVSGNLNPDSGDLEITAGWGHGGKGGVTMPAKGKLVEREYTPDEKAAFAEGALAPDMSAADLTSLLGDTTFDIFLNGNVYWKNIPSNVWEYTLGGYQVIKKWLSYREKELLNRAITKDEARHVTDMARRIAALLLLGPKLDANYAAVKSSTYAWGKN
jgi:hypothetical protein